jgi:hypothetical protein
MPCTLGCAGYLNQRQEMTRASREREENPHQAIQSEPRTPPVKTEKRGVFQPWDLRVGLDPILDRLERMARR